ncbi:MAG TPA: type II toxin-antitoxin system RelE/ParE family toxin [Candidatus Angelobacter sp.]|jgi:addiction module RelE/StbE family toxin|nr:type II toxin-antitoxin system RelE/ParE family toxin [Candidatus Angelobacter sp.]
MKVRWSPAATESFSEIVKYIRQQNPAAALRVAQSIYQAIGQLKKFPHRGRPGKIKGTRELVLPSLPFIVVYRINENMIEIARVLHGAQRWP